MPATGSSAVVAVVPVGGDERAGAQPRREVVGDGALEQVEPERVRVVGRRRAAGGPCPKPARSAAFSIELCAWSEA